MFDLIRFDNFILHGYIKVHEVKKALIKDIGPVNRVHLTVLGSVENIYILGIG